VSRSELPRTDGGITIKATTDIDGDPIGDEDRSAIELIHREYVRALLAYMESKGRTIRVVSETGLQKLPNGKESK
jgi:hypothetical protein